VRDAQVAAIAQAICGQPSPCKCCTAFAEDLAGTLIAPDALTDADVFKLVGSEDGGRDLNLFRATAVVFRADLKSVGEKV
jgi:hypothetical protein